MPAHEIGKRLKLARRFDHPEARYRFRHFRQGAWDGEHQVRLRNSQDGRDKEWNPERDLAFLTECSERPVNHCLMTVTGQNHCMR